MKQVILLLALFLSTGTMAQELLSEQVPLESSKLSSLINRLSIKATAASGTYYNKLSDLKNVDIGEISVSYRITPQMSIGLGTMGKLGNHKSGYTTAEGTFFSFCEDDDDDDMDDHDDDMDDDDDMEDDDDMDDDDDCDDDFGENLMATFTFYPSARFPVFIQAAGGYSFSGKAPGYSAMVGYNQKIISGLSLSGGVRYSDVLHKIPTDAQKTIGTNGFRVELGLNYNF